MIVTTFATLGRYYDYAMRLDASLERLGLERVILAKSDRGSVQKNKRQKPSFLIDQLKLYNAVLWIDADAVVHQRPKLIYDAQGYDLAVYMFADGRMCMNGTLALWRSPRTSAVLERWWRYNERWTDEQEQGNLNKALSDVAGLRVLRLPVEYCWIERLDRRQNPEAKPVIEHFAVSLHTWPARAPTP